MNFRANARVSIELEDDGVAQVRLIRTDKMNALDADMFNYLIEAGQALQNMKGLRAVVLAGEGRAFCAGLDLASFGRTRGDEPPLTERTFGNANRAQQVAMQWRKLPVPVIAAVHGVCFGGGLQIASGADMRIVAPDTRMAVMEMRWGLVPDMGGIALWRGLVRDDVLRELTFTNREFSGAEALTLGLATYVGDEPLARAIEIARTIADRNPHAMRGAKRLINAMADKNTADLLMEESLEQHSLLGSKNQMEAVMAGMEKRKARYEDL